jgi:soluble lytic murein transglycosylase
VIKPVFRQIVIVVILLLAIVVTADIIYESGWFWRLIYPLEYKEVISHYSTKYELDPYLVSAIIYVESRFVPEACSHKGALGLMQIMPDTGFWIAKELDYHDFKGDLLYDPELNIEFGCWYLSNLQQEFGNNINIILAAYNAGSGNVNDWLKKEWDGKGDSLVKLPFSETREYVDQVISVYKQYLWLYRFN